MTKEDKDTLIIFSAGVGSFILFTIFITLPDILGR